MRGRPSTRRSPLIVPTGEAADWTDVSTVLAEVPDRIQCTRLLPDQRTIRFVWGSPPRAEDIDTVTREARLVAARPGRLRRGLSRTCRPMASGSSTRATRKDGRAFAFLSERPDGEDAVPVVPTAEPTMSSEPTWLADGQTFSYDVDTKHMGVFSTVREPDESAARSDARSQSSRHSGL